MVKRDMQGIYALLVTVVITLLLVALGIRICSPGFRSLPGVSDELPYETSAPMLLEDFRENAAALKRRIGQRSVRVYGQIQMLYRDSEPTPVVWLNTDEVVLPAEMTLLAKQPRVEQVRVGDKVWLQCETVSFVMETVTGSDCILE